MRLTYYPDPALEPETSPKTFECARPGCKNIVDHRSVCQDCAGQLDAVRHGYTLTDLHKIARLAVHTAHVMASDWRERFDTAYSAIAEHLYSSSDMPSRYELVSIGKRAIDDSVTDYQRHHGYFKYKTIGAQRGPGSSPAFATFWEPLSRPSVSPENAVVDRMALWQILPELAPVHRDVLTALAVHDDYHAAAEALGLTYVSFRSYISRARSQFLKLWHEGEKSLGRGVVIDGPVRLRAPVVSTVQRWRRCVAKGKEW